MSKRVEFRRVAPVKEGSAGLRFEEFEKIVPCDECEKSGWISVKDRLPEYDTPVIVTYLSCVNGEPRSDLIAKYSIAANNYSGGWADADDQDVVILVEITHWMPLPEPPKEG